MTPQHEAELAEAIRQSTRQHYWQAMREKCAEIRVACEFTVEAKRRTLAHFYSMWREASRQEWRNAA